MTHGTTCPTCNRKVPKPKAKKNAPSPLEVLFRELYVAFAFSNPWPWSIPLRAREPYASWGQLPGHEWRRRYEALMAGTITKAA